MRTFIVDSFTDVPFKGNPAGVCLVEHNIEDELMLLIAQELGLSETAFVRVDQSPYAIRYFSPVMEIPLCGHATLASAKTIFGETESDEICFVTGEGIELPIQRVGNDIRMTFPLYSTQPSEAPAQLLEALGLKEIECAVYNDETRILMLQIQSTKVLGNLRPDFAKLKSSHNSINGVLVTAASGDDGFDFHSRYFWPWSGTNEDPVTGGTHTFMAPWWAKKLGKKKLRSFQASSRTGFMEVEVGAENLVIIGRATTVLSGSLVNLGIAKKGPANA